MGSFQGRVDAWVDGERARVLGRGRERERARVGVVEVEVSNVCLRVQLSFRDYNL